MRKHLRVVAAIALALSGTVGTMTSFAVCPHALADDISALDLADGTYQCQVTLEGGTGRATIESPTTLDVTGGKATLTVRWSSPNYDYMVVDGERYLPKNEEGNSTFEIPLAVVDEPFNVTADTTAMSQPHEIDYTIEVASKSIQGDAGPSMSLPLVCAVVAGGGVALAARMRKGQQARGEISQ